MTNTPPMSDPNGLPPAPPAGGPPAGGGYGAPPPGGGYGTPPAPAYSPPAKKSRVGLIVGVVVVSLVALCGVGGTIAVLALKPAAERAGKAVQSLAKLEPGDCIRSGNGPNHYFGVSCSSAKKIATVTKVFPGPEQQGQDCPADTDLILKETGTIVCLTSDTSERLGQPGKGGGVIVGGDCVGTRGSGRATQYAEVPCTSPNVYEKVAAVADSPAACAAPAVRFTQLPTSTPRVMCLADGPGSAGVGDCVGDILKVQAFVAVPCAGPAAGGKILARKPSKTACDSVPGMTHWIEDGSGLPGSRYLCVKELGR